MGNANNENWEERPSMGVGTSGPSIDSGNNKNRASDDERKIPVKVTVGIRNAVQEEKKRYGVIQICNCAIRYALYILAFSVPLFFLPFTTQALDYNKQMLVVVLSIVAIVAWLVKAVKTGKLVWRRSFANVLILVFLASWGLSTFFSLSRAGSFFGFLNHLTLSFLSIVSFLIIYFLAMNVKTRKSPSTLLGTGADNKRIGADGQESFGGIIRFAFYGIAAASIIGLFQLLKIFVFPFDFAKSASFNTVGTFNSLALLLVAGVVMGLSLIANNSRINREYSRESKLEYGGDSSKNSSGHSRKISEVFEVVATIFMFAMIVLINFWVAWLALVAGLIFLLIFSSQGSTPSKSKIFSLPTIFLILSIIFWQFGFVYSAIPISINVPVEIYPTAKASFEAVKGVLRDKLFFGSGPETFIFGWSRYKPEALNASSLWYVRFNTPSNWWLNILASGGIISFLAVGFFVGYIFYKSVRLSLKGRLVGGMWIHLLSLFVALTAAKIFYSSNIALEFYFWLFAGLIAAGLSKHETGKKKFRLNLDKFPRISAAVSFVLIFAIIGSFTLLFIKGQHYLAEINYKKALTALAERKTWDATTGYFLKAAQLNRYQDTYLRELARIYLQRATEEVAELNNKEKDVSEAAPRIQNFAVSAARAAEAATTLSPNDVANWIQKARIYDALVGYLTGANKEAINSWKNAAELEPSNPYVWTQIGSSYLTMATSAYQEKDKEAGDEAVKEAENSFKKAAEVKPNYALAHYQLAILYEAQGKIKDAIRKLETAGGASPNDHTLVFKLGMMYLKDNQKDKAKAMFTRAVNLNNNYSDALWYLALILESEGDIKGAINLIERVYALNSQNENIKAKLDELKSGKYSSVKPSQQPPLGQEMEERP